MRTVAILLKKDLRLEARTLETVPAMALFTVTVFIMFHFGLNQDTVKGQEAAGIFTATLLISALLGINRLFVAEREQGGFDAFLLAPVDRTAMFVAKATALYIYLVILEIIAVPAFKLFLLQPDIGPAIPGIIAMLALANLGIAAIGTLVSAIAVQTRARDLIGPIIGLPLQIPALIATARGLGPLFNGHGASAPPGKWLAVLALYDAVFTLLAYAVFDFLLEE